MDNILRYKIFEKEKKSQADTNEYAETLAFSPCPSSLSASRWTGVWIGEHLTDLIIVRCVHPSSNSWVDKPSEQLIVIGSHIHDRIAG